MQTKTIAIINQKGGVGKTSLAVTLAHALASPHHHVLICDLDPQGNVTEMLGMNPHPGLFNMLVLDDFWAAVQRSGRAHLDVIGSDHRTVEVKNHLQSRPFGEMLLKQRLEPLIQYAYIILDLAPSIDILQVAALTACTHYLIPVQLDALAVSAARRVVNTAHSLLQLGRLEGVLAGIVPTFWDRTTNETAAQLSALSEMFHGLVYPPVPRDTKMREAAALGRTIIEYAPTARALLGVPINGNRIGGYNQIVNRLQEEINATPND